MINLLPPEKIQMLYRQQSKKLFVVLGGAFVIFLLCLFLVLLSLKYHILAEIAGQEYVLSEIQKQNQSGDYTEFFDIISKYNKNLSLIDQFNNQQLYMSDALDSILSVKRPDGLYFTNFYSEVLENSGGQIQVNISGVSATRDNMLVYKEELEKQKNIKDIYFSPDSWINQTNVNFNITLKLHAD